MHSNCCTSCPMTGSDHLHGSDQITSQQAQPANPQLQKAFYYYDPQKGTRCRLVNATATVTLSSAAGAAGSCLTTAYLPGLLSQDNSLFDRTIQQLEKACPNSSLYLSAALGATLGAAGAAWLIHSAYQGGLKPRTAAALRCIMNGLVHQVEGDYKSIEQRKNSIQINESQLAIRKEEMLAEKERNRVKAQKSYDRELRSYQKDTAKVTGELKGYLTEVFDRLASPSRLPTYEEAVSNTRRAGSYQLGQDVSNFVEGTDFSESARERFLHTLMPYLNERELRNVEQILTRLPKYPPVFWPIVGPLESEYNTINFRCKMNQRKVGELEKRIRDLTAQYNCFELGPDGKVKTPTVAEFSEYLPD